MKISLFVLLVGGYTLAPTNGVAAFRSPAFSVARRPHPASKTTALSATISDDALGASIDTSPRDELLDIARSLKSKNGLLVIDSKGKETLNDAAKALEDSTAVPSTDTRQLVGDWELVCSVAAAKQGPLANNKVFGVDTSKLPFFDTPQAQDLRGLVNKSLKVRQVVKANENGVINRVDHVIEYTPPNSLNEVFKRSTKDMKLPEPLQKLDLNPLQVTAGKVILVHKAEVEDTIPYIDTKLGIQSVVLNVAGTSRQLDPKGADILGLNLPLGEFLNTGGFKTTYMDDTLRISRSKTGVIEQLRIFTRPSAASRSETEDVIVSDVDKTDANKGLLDIDDAVSAVEDVASTAADTAKSVADRSANAVSDAADAAADTTKDIADEVSDRADEAAARTKQSATDTANQAKSAADKTSNRTKDTATDVAEDLKDAEITGDDDDDEKS